MDFTVSETRAGVWKLAGELDFAGVAEVRERFASIEGDISIDCADLTFIDAAGLGVLVWVHLGCKAQGVKLVLAEPPECMAMLLELTGLDALFNVQ